MKQKRIYWPVKNKEYIYGRSIPEPNSGCWLWIGAKHSGGYGAVRLNGTAMASSRATWIIFNGEIPKGMQINHKCNVRLCVNPDHLYVGTAKQNLEDISRDIETCKKRSVKLSRRHRGEGNWAALLTEKDVLNIRKIIIKNKANRCEIIKKDNEIAKKYSVSRYTIQDIRLRRSWSYLVD